MKLNCDLGEGFDEIDFQIMPLIDMANIACGGHAGNAHSIARAVSKAQSCKVSIGAHPSYPDRANFGRQSLKIRSGELLRSLQAQVDNLKSACLNAGAQLEYIKPHGALYNDCMHDDAVLDCCLELANYFNLPLLLQSLSDNSRLQLHSQDYGVELMFEAFADRAYQENGLLVPRKEAHAVHQQRETIVQQAKQLIQENTVACEDGTNINIKAQSLCVHGDNAQALNATRAIRAFINTNASV